MESNEEKFRQFKEKIDKEMEERRAYNKLIEKSITLSICGALLGLSGNLVGISINLCKSKQKEFFINDTP